MPKKSSTKPVRKYYSEYEGEFVRDNTISTIKQFAEKHNLAYQTLKNIAAQNDWTKKRIEYQEKLKLKTNRKTLEKVSEDKATAKAMTIEIAKAYSGITKELITRIEQTGKELLAAIDTQDKDKQERALERLKMLRTIEKGIGINHQSVDRYLGKWLSLEGEIIDSTAVIIKKENLPDLTDEQLLGLINGINNSKRTG